MPFSTDKSRKFYFANKGGLHNMPTIGGTSSEDIGGVAELPDRGGLDIKWKRFDDREKVVMMPPEEYIKRIDIVNRFGSIRKVAARAYKVEKQGYSMLHYPPYSSDSVESILKGFEDGNEFFMPSISYDEMGLVDDQEGYHRAIAAIRVGKKEIPVVIYGDLPEKFMTSKDYRKEIAMIENS